MGIGSGKGEVGTKSAGNTQANAGRGGTAAGGGTSANPSSNGGGGASAGGGTSANPSSRGGGGGGYDPSRGSSGSDSSRGGGQSASSSPASSPSSSGSAAAGRAADRGSVAGYASGGSTAQTASAGSRAAPDTSGSRAMASQAAARTADRASVPGYSGGGGLMSSRAVADRVNQGFDTANRPVADRISQGFAAAGDGSMARGRAADRASTPGYLTPDRSAAASSMAAGRALDRNSVYGPPGKSYAAGGPVNAAQRVVDAGPGFTTVQYADGSVQRYYGTRATRNNNPGNIEYGAFAKARGAIGTDGRFAVFPDVATGKRAMESLLFETPGYAGRTIAEAIGRYAPPSENDTGRYVATAAAGAGASPQTRMADLAPAQRQGMIDAMMRHEGYGTGRYEVGTIQQGRGQPSAAETRFAMEQPGAQRVAAPAGPVAAGGGVPVPQSRPAMPSAPIPRDRPAGGGLMPSAIPTPNPQRVMASAIPAANPLRVVDETGAIGAATAAPNSGRFASRYLGQQQIAALVDERYNDALGGQPPANPALGPSLGVAVTSEKIRRRGGTVSATPPLSDLPGPAPEQQAPAEVTAPRGLPPAITPEVGAPVPPADIPNRAPSSLAGPAQATARPAADENLFSWRGAMTGAGLGSLVGAPGIVAGGLLGGVMGGDSPSRFAAKYLGMRSGYGTRYDPSRGESRNREPDDATVKPGKKTTEPTPDYLFSAPADGRRPTPYDRFVRGRDSYGG